MKYLLLTTLVLMSFVAQSYQQVDCPFSRTIQTDNDYQSTKDCRNIQTLTIQHKTLTAASFPYLMTVSGLLIIDGCDALTSVSFPALTSVSQNVQFTNNTLLQTIDVPSQCTVTGQILITQNGALTSVNAGFSSAAALDIENNSGASWNLTMDRLATVSGAFNLVNNNGLVGASFAALATVNGAFSVSGNGAMTSFSAPTACRFADILTVANQAMLSNLVLNPTAALDISITTNGQTGSGSWNVIMDSLTTAGAVDIKSNQNLNKISMAKLSSAKTFSISTNPSITNVNVAGPFSVTGDLFVDNNNAASDAWDCTVGASSVSGTVSINTNTNMKKLAMNRLVSVGTDLVILQNTVQQIEATNPFTVGGSVTFQSNNKMTSVNLNGLRKVTNTVSIISNGDVSSDSFPVLLNGLSSVSGSFNLNSNKGMTSVEMNNLIVVGGSFAGTQTPNVGLLSIFDNDKLAYVYANGSDFTVQGDVTITNNAGLNKIDMDGLVRVGGSLSINQNTVSTIWMNGLQCATGVLLSTNNGVTDVQFKALNSVQTSVMYNPSSSSGCQMCVGTDCAQCGACVSCNGNTDCGIGANAAWNDACTASPAATCPTTTDNTTVSTEPPTGSSDSGSDSGSASTSDSNSDSGSDSASNSDSSSGSSDANSSTSTTANTNTNTEIVPIETEEGSAIRACASVLAVVLALFATLF